MKYLKFALLNIIVFGILFFLLSLLFPNIISNNKTITVVANKTKIYTTVLSIKDWKQWNEFDKVAGNIITLKFAGNDTISTIWKQQNGRILFSTHNFIAVNKDSTVVNWLLQEKLKWYQPLKKFAALFTDKKIGYAMEVSLNSLKKYIEFPQASQVN